MHKRSNIFKPLAIATHTAIGTYNNKSYRASRKKPFPFVKVQMTIRNKKNHFPYSCRCGNNSYAHS